MYLDVWSVYSVSKREEGTSGLTSIISNDVVVL